MLSVKIAIVLLTLIKVVDAFKFWPSSTEEQPQALIAEEQAELMAIELPEERRTVLQRLWRALPCTGSNDVEWQDEEEAVNPRNDGRPVCNHYFHRHHNPVFCSHYTRRHYEPTSFRGVRKGVLFTKKQTDKLFEKAYHTLSFWNHLPSPKVPSYAQPSCLYEHCSLHKLDRGGHVVRRNRRLLALFPIGRRMQDRQTKQEQLAYQKKELKRQQILLVQQQRKLIEQQRALQLLQAAPVTNTVIQASVPGQPKSAAILAQLKANHALRVLRRKAQELYETLPDTTKENMRRLDVERRALPTTFKVALAPFTRQGPSSAKASIAALPDTVHHPGHASSSTAMLLPHSSPFTPKRTTIQRQHLAARRQLFNRPSKREF